MNLEEVILFKEEKNIDIPELEDDEKNSIKLFIEITRHIQEIEQLFCIFQINLKNLLYFYQINNNDTIVRNVSFDFDEDDVLIVNTFTINFISSGKTVKESIEMFLKQYVGESSQKYIEYITNCFNKLYDDYFGYRLLLRMRDFSQHGHLPVTRDYNNKYAFDLEHILLTPHYNHNKTLENEMKKIKEDIHKKYQDNARIVYTISMIEFNFCIIKTYVEFLNCVEEILNASINNIKKLLKDKPEIIYESDDELNGLVFFDEDDNIHAFDPKEDSSLMFQTIKNKAIILLEKEEVELEEMKKTFRFE